ncbi:hydroxyethylthiazole kinase [Corynebacterium halotolerans]|uniref:hydroxyethylthiazole kinase n=1 Tax=Corynebacterium halotolerans TaxID=225326 RepID=UPI003CF8FBDB
MVEHPSQLISPALERLRQTTPLVQCLTNTVVQQITANVLLAAGASPAMTDTPEEAADFARLASGVLLNAGTPSASQYAGMREAVRGANEAGTPWVLDPVAVGALHHRTTFAREIIAHRPAAIRGNASEIVALAGLGGGGRGVDATDEVAAAIPAARQLQRDTGAVIAVSGAEDAIVTAEEIIWLRSGSPLLQLVIGSGCALGALTAAYLGAARDSGIPAGDAVLTAHAHTGAAGQLAARRASSPGSFAVAWVDALYELDAAGVAELVAVRRELA